MQLRTLCCVALAGICLTASAQKKTKRAKKTQPAAALTPAKTVKSVDGKTYSYALGIAQGESLKQYLTSREGVDTAYIDEAIRGMNGNLTPEEKQKAIAYAAGIKIAQMNERNAPFINKEACGKEDSLYFNTADFQRGLTDKIQGATTTLSTDSAMKVVEAQITYQKETYKAANAAFLANTKKLKGVKTLPSGLQYSILTQGTGPVATDSTECEVHYEGSLIDGTVFDSSYKRGKPATFKPNQVIKGWKEALTMMPEGSVWNLYIPSDLGYGERGMQNIPGNSTLVFKVELIKVKTPAAAPAAEKK